jgi:hypothetical protein
VLSSEFGGDLRLNRLYLVASIIFSV